MGVFSRVAVIAEAGQTVVGDPEDEAIVHHTVGRLEFSVREDDAVVEENHSLKRQETGSWYYGRDGDLPGVVNRSWRLP